MSHYAIGFARQTATGVEDCATSRSSAVDAVAAIDEANSRGWHALTILRDGVPIDETALRHEAESDRHGALPST